MLVVCGFLLMFKSLGLFLEFLNRWFHLANMEGCCLFLRLCLFMLLSCICVLRKFQGLCLPLKIINTALHFPHTMWCFSFLMRLQFFELVMFVFYGFFLMFHSLFLSCHVLNLGFNIFDMRFSSLLFFGLTFLILVMLSCSAFFFML